MKELEVRLQANGQAMPGHTLDLGEWDIAEGFSTTLYFHNPNPHAKGVLKELKNLDSRIKISVQQEIAPLETIPIHITIPAHEYNGEEDEREFFTDMIDALSGRVKWVRP